MDKSTDWLISEWESKWMDLQANEWIYGQMGGWMYELDGWIDGCTGGWLGGWTCGRQMNEQISGWMGMGEYLLGYKGR